jgi:hypothetical protein
MTIEIPQTQLAMAIATAVLSGAVLAAAASENSAAAARRLQDAADELALAVGLSGCKGDTINLSQWSSRLPAGIASVLLLRDRVRITPVSGASVSSFEFPALANDAPIELLDHASLHLARDLFTLACYASTVDG